MKKIGGGWQCSVYDLGNGRVLKKEKLFPGRFFTILFSKTGPKELLYGAINNISKAWRESLSGLVEILKNPKFDSKSLGSPEIDLKTLSYTQNKVVPVHKVFKNYSFDEKQKFFKGYVELIKYLWGFGIHEKIFNFHLNAGIDDDGNVVLIDLGELSFDKEQAMEDVSSNRWARAYSHYLLDQEVKSMYEEIMKRELTPFVLNTLWEQKKF